ncbi:phosphatidylinositol-glycan biosynthesis class F protein isoform X3 [Canis lupus familiaris]|uniref:phosphatidylinositol-glycan biosynthesis class F protein isoform X3 n=1 Tax=Canis lupus familiaris TaxID=9615 RepID=UPI000BA9FCA9|nr:phosphatidylinositol-glycan biosynthesis class F protein isoform X3 [Canis lupus familiaris]XP_038407138.1 phosphatidylinositol-glycan biosynthesis class F protein isoform X3 [Canis lupus familiaris]XP_038536421.1 phosphatidylinositol-glycan biosynthesis class F protein isoform X3 [Canis lupus familiaris]|eukprot:XP_022280391.1 phosphatidylinositol-glycan biosynthesis class F protein isoform X3 [Canis lupus familiaris]
MKDTDIKRLLYTHLLCIFSIILSICIPSFFLENFSILETHLTWLCICSVFVTAVNLVLYLIVKPNASSKRSSISYKVTRFLKCCIYFLMSCFFFHVIFVLYGAPLIELVLETFLFAVILSTFTTVPCLCLLGPNIKAWLRVFSRNGQNLTTFGELKNLNFWREVPELVVILPKLHPFGRTVFRSLQFLAL